MTSNMETLYKFTQISGKQAYWFLNIHSVRCLFCHFTPAWAPFQCWGGVCRIRRRRDAGMTVLGWGAACGCRWGESRDRGKKAHCWRPGRAAETPLSTTQTWRPSCSSCSCWTLFCCAFECRPSSWWGAGWPGRRKKSAAQKVYLQADFG